MRTFSIKTNSGGFERVEGDSFNVTPSGMLEIQVLSLNLDGDARSKAVLHVVALYADKWWLSIKEVK